MSRCVPKPSQAGKSAALWQIGAGIVVVCFPIVVVAGFLALRRPSPIPEPTPPRAVGQTVAPVTKVAESTFKRRQNASETELLEMLRKDTREVDIDTERGTSAKLLGQARGVRNNDEQPVLALLDRRADLKGLPVRKGAECRAGDQTAVHMEKLATEIRVASEAPEFLRDQRDAALKTYLSSQMNTRGEGELRILLQMLQVKSTAVRLELIKKLSSFSGDGATLALAQRALFDLSPEVREASVEALKGRPRTEFRFVLLDGLRYPWAPVADHAAEALVALEDRDVVPTLKTLLDRADPRVPTQDAGKNWKVTEVVRVNHLRNCLLCHPPSFNPKDSLRGMVPESGLPLPTPQGGGYGDRPDGNFVRADLTYLKQDFSAIQPVAGASPWPSHQRFDYFVRQREFRPEESVPEVAKLLSQTQVAPGGRPSSYPQREAVLWALRHLKND
jgi:hypothetical protein